MPTGVKRVICSARSSILPPVGYRFDPGRGKIGIRFGRKVEYKSFSEITVMPLKSRIDVYKNSLPKLIRLTGYNSAAMIPPRLRIQVGSLFDAEWPGPTKMLNRLSTLSFILFISSLPTVIKC
jgi:hypothetical protein